MRTIIDAVLGLVGGLFTLAVIGGVYALGLAMPVVCLGWLLGWW